MAEQNVLLLLHQITITCTLQKMLNTAKN